MCRLMLFAGKCPRCCEDFVWEDLCQELWCLEAKNTGTFGHCRRGVVEDRHDFDQECDPCAEAEGADEGVADMSGEEEEREDKEGAEEEREECEGDGGGRRREAEKEAAEDGRRRKRQRVS